MRKLLLCLLCGSALGMVSASATPPVVVPGSPLERLIRDNQEIGMLRPEELDDRIPVPLWLRVWWRKGHPDGIYSAEDPTGGYPHVLREIHEWMITHQDLRPGLPRVAYGAGLDVLTEAAVSGFNLRVSGAHNGPRSESDIRVNYWDPRKIISASNNISGSGRQGQYWSTDGGSTWGQTELPLAPGDGYHSDPTVDWTSDGTAWSTTIGIYSTLRMQAYRSTDNGATWIWDSTFSGSHTAADKQMMWVDHSATSPYADTIYVCWHNHAPQFVNRRTASGWGTPLQISGAETSGTAIGCDVKTNADGDVFVFWPATGNRRILVSKSTNGGASFAKPVTVATTYDSYDIGVPAFNDRRALIYVSGGAWRTDTRNMVYASWTDLSGGTGCASAADEPASNALSPCKTRIWFARSSDGGATWGTPRAINPSASLNDQFNPWLAVDETSGRIAVIYYDTIGDPARRKTNVYYQASADDGASWSPPFRVTTVPTDESGGEADSGNQYGDYNGLSGYAGSFWPSWTDRRNDGSEEIWTANVLDDSTPPAAPDLDFYTVAPCRLIDTRLAAGPLVSSSLRSFALAGSCGIPATAGALVVNVTAIAPTASGDLILFPSDEAVPATSTVSFTAGLNRANNAVLPLSPTGAFTVKASTAGTVDFTLDVVGYFE